MGLSPIRSESARRLAPNRVLAGGGELFPMFDSPEPAGAAGGGWQDPDPRLSLAGQLFPEHDITRRASKKHSCRLFAIEGDKPRRKLPDLGSERRHVDVTLFQHAVVASPMFDDVCQTDPECWQRAELLGLQLHGCQSHDVKRTPEAVARPRVVSTP